MLLGFLLHLCHFDGIILMSGQRTLRKKVPMQCPFTLSLVVNAFAFSFLTPFLPETFTIDIRRSWNSSTCRPSVVSSSLKCSIRASLSIMESRSLIEVLIIDDNRHEMIVDDGIMNEFPCHCWLSVIRPCTIWQRWLILNLICNWIFSHCTDS